MASCSNLIGCQVSVDPRFGGGGRNRAQGAGSAACHKGHAGVIQVTEDIARERMAEGFDC